MKRLLIILVLILPLAAASQEVVKARVAGLESNSEYMELLMQERKLHQREDSLTRVVAAIRADFKAKPEMRAQYSTQILNLEGEIFDVRSQIGMAAGRITIIEQEFVINNIDKQTNPYLSQAPDTSKLIAKPMWQSPYFTDNIYLRENLAAADYGALRNAQAKELPVANYIQIYRSNYNTITHLSNTYLSTDNSAVADSIYSKYKVLMAINRAITDSVSALWSYIYDNKSYAYNYLMDKMNQNDELTKIENRMMSIRGKEAEIRDMYASNSIAAYSLRKKFLLDYEIKLSQILGLNHAVDSLTKVNSAMDTTLFNFAKVELKERFFIDYQSAEIRLPSQYNSGNPIHKCIVYPRGTIYRIMVGTYTRAQSPTIFRGAYPLSYIKGSDGKYTYYVGGYASNSEAVKAAAMLKQAGLRTSRVAVWVNGVLGEPESRPEIAAQAQSIQNLYTIEITTTQTDLSDAIKSLIATHTPAKEILRSANRFIVSSFNSLSDAETLAAQIRAQDPNLSVKIATISI